VQLGPGEALIRKDNKMREKYLSQKPNKPGTREIRIEPDIFGHNFSRSGYIYKIFVNGQFITRHDDFMEAMTHIRNTIYGYDKEIMAY